MSQFHKDLKDKLEQTQSAQDETEKSKYSLQWIFWTLNTLEDIEHKEFLQMRKQHYKNEFSPAMLLKQGSRIEDDEEEEEESNKWNSEWASESLRGKEKLS